MVDLWFTLLYYRTREQAALERSRRRAWASVLAECGTPRSRAIGEADRWIARIRQEEFLGRSPPIESRVAALVAASGHRLSVSRLTRELDRWILGHPAHVGADARRALMELRGRGVPLGIVSNVSYESASATRRLLRRLRVEHLFDAIVLSPETGFSKPSPVPFRVCRRRMGGAAGPGVFLGDQLFDILGARAAGVRPILFEGYRAYLALRPDWPRSVARGVARLRRWADLVPLLYGGPVRPRLGAGRRRSTAS